MINGAVIWVGLLHGAYYVPVAIAFALASHHGKYLPLWLPECGMLAAFAALLAMRAHAPAWVGLVAAAGVGVLAALALHCGLFAHHVESGDAYSGLLRGVGVIVAIESTVRMVTGGYALSFGDALSQMGGDGRQGAAVLGAAVMIAAAIWSMTRYTRAGLVYRCIASNRRLAAQFGMPVRVGDLLVIAASGLLCAISGVGLGVRYGLTANMMFDAALKSVAVAVAVGTGNMLAVAGAALGLGVAESLCQANTLTSGMSEGVTYALLIAGILAHYVAWPAVQRRRRRREWQDHAELAGVRG